MYSIIITTKNILLCTYSCVDWWALGILLYEMLVGYPPFFADNPFALYQKILKGSVKFPVNAVATTAQGAIKGLLNTNRNSRIAYSHKRGFSPVANCSYFKGIDSMLCCDYVYVYVMKYLFNNYYNCNLYTFNLIFNIWFLA